MTSVFNRLFANFGPMDYDDGPERTYINRCPSCSQTFLGYKGRLSCRICTEAYDAKLAAMTPAERKQHDDEKLIAWAEAAQKIFAQKPA